MSGWLYQPLFLGAQQLSGLEPPAGNLTLSTSAPVFVNSGSPAIEVPSANLTLTTTALVITPSYSIEVPSANLTLSTVAPIMDASVAFEIPYVNLSLTTFAPSGLPVVVPSANLVLSSTAPETAHTIPKNPPSANLALSAVAPTITAGTSAAIAVPSANLTLSESAPNASNLIVWVAQAESDLLCPGDITIELVNSTDTGGRSLTGKKQYVQPDAGYWRITYDRIRIRSNDDVLQWRKLAAETEGRANPILIQAWDLKRAPSNIVATANATALVGSATVIINVASGEAPMAGNNFSDVNERLYRIRKIVSQVGNVYTVKVRPPLRASIPSGSVLEFAFPVLRSRLERDDSMNITLDLMQHATPTVAFVEDPE